MEMRLVCSSQSHTPDLSLTVDSYSLPRKPRSITSQGPESAATAEPARKALDHNLGSELPAQD